LSINQNGQSKKLIFKFLHTWEESTQWDCNDIVGFNIIISNEKEKKLGGSLSPMDIIPNFKEIKEKGYEEYETQLVVIKLKDLKNDYFELILNDPIDEGKVIINIHEYVNELFRFIDECIVNMEKTKVVDCGKRTSLSDKIKKETINITKKRFNESKQQYNQYYQEKK